jgi:poly-gamma-glutamate capsule biosynthesis protein CapA/YwtB (metallophosphatase superfamily)
MKLKKKFKILGVLLFLIIVFLSLPIGPKPNKIVDNVKKIINKDIKKEYKLNLLMVGDALIHSTVYQKAAIGNNEYNFDPMFTYIKPIVAEYDLAFYNQESIIGGKELGLSTYPRFNSPEEIGDSMVNMGFNLVSLANNHTLDKGEQGIINSTNYWKQKQVMTAGSYNNIEDRNKINVMEKNNIKYALLSYTTLTNGLPIPSGKDYLVNLYNPETVKQDVDKIRNQVDVLMVSIHWGTEYTHTPTAQQEEIANYLSSLEVDIIIGHHPHVVQPIKYINNTMVIYSLGNFISAQIGMNKLIGLMVMVDINKTVDNNNTTININNLKTELIYTYKTRTNYQVIPFSNLNSTLLPNYQNYYQTYSSIIKKYDNNIVVNGIK